MQAISPLFGAAYSDKGEGMNTTLVIMAAGIGSRFGGGIKQLEPVGPNGEIIMDYSIYDAIQAGFNKVVFIIRKDIEKDFKEIIGDRISKVVHVEYVFQALDDLPDGFAAPKERTKPWGTGQAILCIKDVVHEPFVAINADDYYGKEGFVAIQKYMQEYMASDGDVLHCCMSGFYVKNTLSENGAVTRGICKVSENGDLLEVVETFDIDYKAGSHTGFQGSPDHSFRCNLPSCRDLRSQPRPFLYQNIPSHFPPPDCRPVSR